jgi:ATP-binding protein involved in chromosome partitioning
MTVAVPVSGGKLSPHFGHCEQFALFAVEDQTVGDRRDLTPPPHEPGVLPRWLKEQGVNVVIAGGMGQRAQMLFEQEGIQVVCGAPPQDPGEAVRSYVSGSLEIGDNACDH